MRGRFYRRCIRPFARIGALRAVVARTGVLCAVIAGLAAPAFAESVLTRGNGGEPATLDPHYTDNRPDSNILRDLFEGLVVYGPDGRILPGIAESWDVTDDGLIYTFRLRAAAKWSNGDPISAEDFVYSLRRAIAPRPRADRPLNMGVIRNADAVMKGEKPPAELGVDAPDARTLRIVLKGPTPYFLALLSADNNALPVHRASVDADPDHWAEPGRMVSSGPYRLKEWQPKQRIVLERNPNYYGNDGVRIDRVVYLPISSAAEELRLLREGKLDLTYEVPQEQVKWISLSNPKEFWNKPFLATYYYAFNLNADPFKGNRALRKALSLAVNREALADKVTRAGEMPAYSLVPPAITGYRRQAAAFIDESMDKRLEQARHLFAEAGYSPAQPLNLELLYNTTDNNRKIANAIIDMWKETFGRGIVITPVSIEWTDYLNRRRARQFQIVRAQYSGNYADPTQFLNLMQSEAKPPRNDPGFKSADYDALLEKAGQTVDPAARMVLLQQAERLLMDEYAIIPLYHLATKSMVSARVQGMTFNIRDVHPTRFLDVAN